MPEKKIEDYLHLYFGCKHMQAAIVPGQELNFEEGKLDIRALYGAFNNLSVIKPLLRKLSSMTEEEKRQFADLNNYNYRDNADRIETTDNILRGMEFEAESFRFLLSKGFDLFGLIDAGLAIEKQ